MRRQPVTLNIIERVGAVVDVLRGTTHAGFPVVALPPTVCSHSRDRESSPEMFCDSEPGSRRTQTSVTSL